MKIHTPKYNWQGYKFGGISLCMIMKDSAKTLMRCLNSVRGLINEVIIIDTGSTDNSIQLAKEYGAKVFSDPWQDDFARPRNIGLAHASCSWILVMDPDETISRVHHRDLQWLTREKDFDSYLLTTFNYGPFIRDQKYRLLKGHKDPTGKFPGYTPSTKTRFFRNNLGIKFEGCYHELVDWYIFKHNLRRAKSTIPIHHWTHEYSQKTMREKRIFYLRLAEKKVREWPKSGKAWWEKSIAEIPHGYYRRAAYSIAKAIHLGFIGSHQFFALAKCLRKLDQSKLADFCFEKGNCHLFPMLTHIELDKRPISTLLKQLHAFFYSEK